MNSPVPIDKLPSAKDLTPKQRAFIDNLVTNGGDKTQAAIDAGYSESTARVQAYDMLNKPHLMQALLERTMVEMISNAPAASNTLRQLLEAKSDYVRLEAAKDLLDRAGLKPVEKHDHKVSGDVSVSIDLS